MWLLNCPRKLSSAIVCGERRSRACEIVMESTLNWTKRGDKSVFVLKQQLLNDCLWNILVALFHVVRLGSLERFEPFEANWAL